MASLRNLAVGALRLAGQPNSPPRCGTPAATPPDRLPSSAWHTNELDITLMEPGENPPTFSLRSRV